MSKILVTGGAGYIGSFMVRRLQEKGYDPIVLDNLSRSVKDSVPQNVPFYLGNVSDLDLLKTISTEHEVEGIIHFAAFISMKESMEKPELYFEQNSFETMRLLSNMHEIGIKNIIFSSTAGVYGNPQRVPIQEDDKKQPTNPYGESKLLVEKMLPWYQQIYGINFTVLRYFNACGAALDGSYGENHNPETHIIPLALKSLMEGTDFTIYGTDYNTIDGTCVRDYIHVLDLSDAHILALEKIMKTGGGFFYNVGTGKGYSNKQIVEAIQEVTGKELHTKEEGRRPGDADELVADVSSIREKLGFNPQYSDIHTIIDSAWKWHNK